MAHTDPDRPNPAPKILSRGVGWLISLGGLLFLAACPMEELPSDLGECPDGSSVSWADVRPVFADNCTRCHSSELVTPDDRSDATEGFDYDSPEGARSSAWLLWSQISSGRMPKDSEFSNDDDALLVWEWLSCDGPE